MLLASAVVVWEWLNEHGRWRPYSPAVSHHIEAVIRANPRGGSVVLGQVDSKLSPYIIDLHSMHQFRQDTGTLRPVRRSLYEPSSAPAQGWQWEWEGDGGRWTPYDTQVSIALQCAMDRQLPWLDLAPLGFCYTVDLQNMTQVNQQTHRRRRVQRRSDQAYPLVTGVGGGGGAGARAGGGGGAMVMAMGGGGGAGGGGGGNVQASAGANGSSSSNGGSGLVGVNSGIFSTGALSAALASLPQACGCPQCMLVLSVKAHSLAHSLGATQGRKPQQLQLQQQLQFKAPVSKTGYPTSATNSSHTRTLPLSFSLSRARAAAAATSHPSSLTSSLTLSRPSSSSATLPSRSFRPPPPSLPPPLPPPPPPPLPPPPLSLPPPLLPLPPPPLPSSISATIPTPTTAAAAPSSASTVAVVTTSSSSSSSSSSASSSSSYSSSSRAPPPVPGPPLPPRSSLAGLSRPALQRIAMAQSRALIASGVPTVPVKNLNGSSPVHPALAGITGILMSAAGLPVCLTRPPRLVLHPPPVSKSEVKPVPGLGHCCRKTSKRQARRGKTPEEVVKKYLQKVRNPPEEDCTICMESLVGPSGYKGPVAGGGSRGGEPVGRLMRCGHLYHLQCLVAMYNNGNKDGSLQCPTCKTIYGVKTGTQPPGKMEYHTIPHSLPGHPDCRAIRIIYTIPPGIQGPEHPNPGKPYTARGFPRHCYLPDNEKGRKVLRLLLVAWERRLVFSVGTSSTTGESDTVVWNEVHHKTEFGSNLTGHGYPDPGHLDNVLQELRQQGIWAEEEEEEEEEEGAEDEGERGGEEEGRGRGGRRVGDRGREG